MNGSVVSETYSSKNAEQSEHSAESNMKSAIEVLEKFEYYEVWGF